MICIKGIDAVSVERDFLRIQHFEGPRYSANIGATDAPPLQVTEEMVRGRKYLNSYGELVCIGMSKQVSAVLGLPFEAFENLNRDLENAQSAVRVLRVLRASIRNTGFLARLKYLITGRLTE